MSETTQILVILMATVPLAVLVLLIGYLQHRNAQERRRRGETP